MPKMPMRAGRPDVDPPIVAQQHLDLSVIHRTGASRRSRDRLGVRLGRYGESSAAPARTTPGVWTATRLCLASKRIVEPKVPAIVSAATIARRFTVNGACARVIAWPFSFAAVVPARITSTSVPRRTTISPVLASNVVWAPAASAIARSGRKVPPGVVTGATSEASRWPSTLIVAGFDSASESDATRAVTAVAAISRPLGTSAARALNGSGLTMNFVSIVRVLLLDHLLDLEPQPPQQVGFREGPHEHALAVDGALAFAPCYPYIGHLGLAWAVDHTSHDGDFDRRGVLLGDGLDQAGQLDDLDLGPAARRAGGDVEALLAQPERLEDPPGDRDLLDRVGRQRDAQRVADPLEQQHSQADGRLDRAVDRQPGLGDAEVQRVGCPTLVQRLRQQAVRVDRRP